MSEMSLPHAHGTEPTRRDFLFLATGMMAAVGGAATLWPMIDQMNPDAETMARGGPIDINVKDLAPGQQMVALWQGHPVFVVHRTPAALAELQKPDLVARLADPDSANLQQPPYAANWHRSIKPEILVLIGVCTHLGCIPKFDPQPGEVAPDWPGGYLCPCHGSKYDLAGRVFKSVPAPYNLPAPPYHFPDDNTLRVGENPAGQTFDFNSILQV